MLHVNCVIIQHPTENKILIPQRSEKMSLPLKWEFPGGKVRSQETPEESLIREIKEELNLDIHPLRSLTPNTHHYPEFSIQLIPFLCKLQGGTLKILEHKTIKWISKNDLMNYDWAEADVPIVEEWDKLWKVFS